MAAVPPAFARGALRADAPRRAHYGRVFDVAFCPWDDSLFATAGEDETARVWRDETRAISRARAWRRTARAAATGTRSCAWSGIPR